MAAVKCCVYETQVFSLSGQAVDQERERTKPGPCVGSKTTKGKTCLSGFRSHNCRPKGTVPGTRPDHTMINETARAAKLSNNACCCKSRISSSACTEIERVVPRADPTRHDRRLTLSPTWYLSISSRILKD